MIIIIIIIIINMLMPAPVIVLHLALPRCWFGVSLCRLPHYRLAPSTATAGWLAVGGEAVMRGVADRDT
jgi:hypothetical protein